MYNHTCYCVNVVSVTSASRYLPRYQSRSSMYIRGLIPRNFAGSAEAVAIGYAVCEKEISQMGKASKTPIRARNYKASLKLRQT